MSELMQLIKERKHKLESSKLSLSMKDGNLPVQERLSFIPSMLFFVMGFKDVLETLEVKDTTDPIQKKVNTHCLEDEGHWRWYLHDLKELEFNSSYLNNTKYKIFELLWHDDHKAAREMIYQTIHYSKLSAGIPGAKLVIIEVLEAAFAAFLSNMHKLVKEAGLFDTLEYFGKRHQDQEDNHSIGSWLDEEQHKNSLEKDIPAEHIPFTQQVINNLFDHFDAMFDCWYAMQKPVPVEKNVLAEISQPSLS
ncbi:MAG TPA: hypothetical protein VD908_15275 [Cytophagales bacterium]|nr:hypothetical protein [Cytophagales bacterium]